MNLIVSSQHVDMIEVYICNIHTYVDMYIYTSVYAYTYIVDTCTDMYLYIYGVWLTEIQQCRPSTDVSLLG